MNGREKIERFLYILILGLLILSVFPLYAFFRSAASFGRSDASFGRSAASFGTWLEPVAAEKSGVPDRTIPPVPEPSEAYSVVTLTFGGVWPPVYFSDDGSVFGSIAEYTENDDYTFAVCGGRNDSDPSEAALTESGVSWVGVGQSATAELREGVRAGVYCCDLPGAGSADDPGEEAAAVRDALSWIESRTTERDFTVICVWYPDDSFEASPEKQSLFRSFLDAGADLVIGAGGTKLQRTEAYGGGLIVYSPGMLIGADSPEEYAALLQIRLKANDGRIFETEWDPIPVRTSTEEGTPCPAPVADEAEREAVLAFLNGETASPAG